MSEDEADDQRWFDVMAGRNPGDARQGTDGEAAWLRAALLAYPPQPPAGTMPDPAQRVQSLIAKAHSAGVLRAHEPAGAAGPRWWRWFRRRHRSAGVALALASVLTVVVVRLGVLDGPPAREIEVLRGAEQQQVQAADPALRQQQIVTALRAAGLDATPFERLGRAGVEVELPVPLPAAQAKALRSLGLQAPPGPALLIEIVPLPQATR